MANLQRGASAPPCYHKYMRILLFSGKGGVGKTSLAAATGVQLARLGYRTLVMSVDPAHSLADSFDLETSLFHEKTGDPYPIADKLAIHEVNIQKEIKRHWREISAYVISVLRTTGISDVEAEELAILPGMEELSAMMWVNQFRREQRYDVIVLDCAPTAESMRFVSMPTTLDWYMKHIFPFQRTVLKAVRPLANRVSPVELPPDSYFANIQNLFGKLEGIDDLLENPRTTSVRLVTNPEKMVLRETQRAFVYFSLHGLTVDGIIVNRVLPEAIKDSFFAEWRESQQRVLAEIDAYFSPVPVKHVPLFTHEVLGAERLQELARALYADDEDPAAVTRTEAPYSFTKRDGHYEVQLQLPFAMKGEVGLFKKGDELVVQIGTLRRHIGLPTSMAALTPAHAKLENKVLTVEMREN
jgi:arsenite-transporting ATPase